MGSTTACIVLADDNAAFREVTAQLLERVGYRVITAGDGREALLAVQEHKPDLLLLDIMMPQVNGMDVLRHRVIVTYEAEAEEISSEDIVKKVFDQIEVP